MWIQNFAGERGTSLLSSTMSFHIEKLESFRYERRVIEPNWEVEDHECSRFEFGARPQEDFGR